MSRHHKASGWANKAKSARERVAATLPAPCVEGCGYAVLPSDDWDVGHRVSLALGGSVDQYGPAHRRCNRSKGGKLGAAVRYARARAPQSVTRPDPRMAKW